MPYNGPAIGPSVKKTPRRVFLARSQPAGERVAEQMPACRQAGIAKNVTNK
jgi:hypothetical protein